MTMCKFFLQGNCRFGNTCRFEHSYNSKYSYHAPQSNVQQVPQGPVTDEQLLNQVRADVQSALKGGQWILSSYAPFKEKPILPGLSDLSPEEARLFMYEAMASNAGDQAAIHMNNLAKEARQKYEQLLQPTPAMINILRRLYNGENVPSPFSTQNSFGTSSAASSVFRSAMQNTSSVFGQSSNNSAASVFGQANSIFGGSNQNAQSVFSQATQSIFGSPQSQTPSLFGVQSPDVAKSIFTQANQNTAQSQNVFQTAQQPNAASIFGNASQQLFATQPTFGQHQPIDPFNQQKASDLSGQKSPFTQAPLQNQNVFQRVDQSTVVFSVPANVFEQQNPEDEGTYSKMTDLTETDLEAFNSVNFKLGFIPEIPPPQSLCV